MCKTHYLLEDAVAWGCAPWRNAVEAAFYSVIKRQDERYPALAMMRLTNFHRRVAVVVSMPTSDGQHGYYAEFHEDVDGPISQQDVPGLEMLAKKLAGRAYQWWLETREHEVTVIG